MTLYNIFLNEHSDKLFPLSLFFKLIKNFCHKFYYILWINNHTFKISSGFILHLLARKLLK